MWPGQNVRWHTCRTKLARKFFLSYEFSYEKNAPKFHRFFGSYPVGPKSPQNCLQISRKTSLQKSRPTQLRAFFCRPAGRANVRAARNGPGFPHQETDLCLPYVYFEYQNDEHESNKQQSNSLHKRHRKKRSFGKRVLVFFLLMVRHILLTVGLCCLRLIGLALFYLQLKFGLSFVLTMEISLVFFTYSSPRPEIGAGLFLLSVPPP